MDILFFKLLSLAIIFLWIFDIYLKNRAYKKLFRRYSGILVENYFLQQRFIRIIKEEKYRNFMKSNLKKSNYDLSEGALSELDEKHELH